MKKYDIIIVGAGASGIGMACALRRFNISNFLVLEKGQIGDSFIKWPKTTQFITPSFTTNGFGFPDINAVVPDTSPAFTFEKEHLSGLEYAEYLRLVAQNYQLPINTKTLVKDIKKVGNDYLVTTDKEQFLACYLIMATGEFQNPNKTSIKGAELGMHYGEVDSFHVKSYSSFIIIGGNESGCDALTHLAYLGNEVSLYTSSFGKSETAPDPSISLSPITKERLKHIQSNKDFNIHLFESKKATAIEKDDDQYRVIFDDGNVAYSKHRPILATGFKSCVHNINGISLFEYQENDIPLLTENDESTIHKNIFLIGPSVRQKDVIFCYIYKFRQRLAPIIAEIAKREHWSLDEEELATYRDNHMFLDDLSCCAVSCDC
ncbi:hypothetical protein HMPREF9318_00814 [Streptococcus urinalis FB127-CNA-2]|uniref:Pyridine nucleotide-disulfide oxidoreductase n=1 Tax=Streptococcus urinalis 2285-97 TaxID=764291 RepID=G5KHU8_9STRE|nr:NAD(P)/FAD-dependent oxidoreductase [Streptococcus urinalis]EHJ57127.1 pyridine nucleotide-disulfide oxidoreductase [Streptococcus urinalis 2285-97]EKS22616.1 hypothetical protein HMPREF9318_00814 [Streptococcus urinalis FB127-CNA-2]VEF32385.1 probable monooxygenase [Streptococcus urinalis]